jgi:hypothetical protein
MFPAHKPYHKKTVYDRVYTGVFMGEVVSFYTGEKLDVEPKIKREDTVELIESLYQRRYQLKSILIAGFEQRTGEFIFGYSYLDEEELDRMQAALNRRVNKVLGDYGEEISLDDSLE